MSSFNINGPGNKPMIQESQNMKNNGGGGNLGYFQRGRKKKGENTDEEINDYFIKETDNDEKEKGGKKQNLFDKLKSKIKKKVEDIAEAASQTNKTDAPASKKDGFLSLSKDVEDK